MVRTVHRRYRREFGVAMMAYIAAVVLVFPLAREVRVDALKWLLALVPMVPVVLAVRASVRLVLGSDELEQRQHLVGLAVAVVVVGLLSMLAGLLVAAGAIDLRGTALLWVFPALAAAYGLTRQWMLAGFGVSDEWGGGAARSWLLLLAAAGFFSVAAWLRAQVDAYTRSIMIGMGVAMLLVFIFQRLVRHRARRHAGAEGPP